MRLGNGISLRFFVLAAALALAACGSTASSNVPQPQGTKAIIATVPDVPAPDTASLTPSNQHVTLSKAVWDDYQTYLKRVGRIGNGYYAVTEDGVGGASWSCSDAFCGGSYDGKNAAQKQCEASNTGKKCVIFAKDNRVQMKYDLAE